MTATPRLIRLLLATAAAGVLALAAPATGLGAEEGTSTTTKTETSAPVETTTTTVPETPAAPTTSSSTESAPAPAPATAAPSAPEVATTPQVSSRQAQGSTPSRAHPRVKSNGAGGQRGGGNGGSPATPRRGKRAPRPSALTPPLPLSLSSSIAGIPGFFIESFRIPPFLLPIYQAAGTAYGVPWQVLAAINEVETDYGRDLSVSSANAEGWMQFLPSSWATYGVDANGDGFKDPYNPADAIFAAARYLRAAGAATNVRAAVFAYNHSQAYVESVMLRAKLLGGTPSELLGAITGLTQARFPVHAQSHFSDGFQTLPADRPGPPKTIAGTIVYSRTGRASDCRPGWADRPDRRLARARAASSRCATPTAIPTPTRSSGASRRCTPCLSPTRGPPTRRRIQRPRSRRNRVRPAPRAPGLSRAEQASPPQRRRQAKARRSPVSRSERRAGWDPGRRLDRQLPAGHRHAAGARSHLLRSGRRARTVHRRLRVGIAQFDAAGLSCRPQRRLPASAAHGRAGDRGDGARARRGRHRAPDRRAATGPHMLFQIRPAGLGAPLIDPKPILDGWVALENSSIFRAKGENPFLATARRRSARCCWSPSSSSSSRCCTTDGITIYAMRSSGRPDRADRPARAVRCWSSCRSRA